MRGNLFANILNCERLIDTRSNKKAKTQRPFCGKHFTFSKSKEETNNRKWMRTWLECELPDKTGEFFFKLKLALENQFTVVANKSLWSL